MWGASWWDAGQAIGTIGAVIVALLLAYFERRRARRAEAALAREREEQEQRDRVRVAALVTGWVETEYELSESRNHYLKRATLYVANESNEPVFDTNIAVGLGMPVVQIGPVAAPKPIPVLPPRSERSWDISLGLLAFSSGFHIPKEPVVRLFFTDSNGVRWVRSFDGDIEIQGEDVHDAPTDEAEGFRQLGEPGTRFSPQWQALGFLSLIRQEEPLDSLEPIAAYLAENSPLTSLSLEEILSLGAELEDFGLAAHAFYPAPQVAHVRLIHEEDQQLLRTELGYIAVRAYVVTLVFQPGSGWKILNIDTLGVEPDWIDFPEGYLSNDPWQASFTDDQE